MSEINNPTNEEAVADQAAEMAADTAGQSANVLDLPPQKNKSWLIALIAAVVIILVEAIVMVFGRSTPKEKVEKAMKNTFSHKSLLWENMSRFKGANQKSNTMGVNVKVDSEQMAFELKMNEELLQLWGKVNMEEIPEMELWANLTDTQVEARVSELEDTLIVYKFREPKTGVLLDYTSRETLDMIDEALIMITDLLKAEEREEALKKQKEAGKELIQIFMEEYEKLEITEADKASYEVDGQTVECQGYKMLVPGESAKTILQKTEAVYEKYGFDYWTVYEEFYENPFELLYDADFSEDLEISFYLAQKKVVAIVLNNQVELLFDGDKDQGTWSMEMVVEEQSIWKLESTVEGNNEEIVLAIGEVPMIDLSYNGESSQFELNIGYYIPYAKVSGVMEFSENELRIAMDKLESAYFPFEMTIDYYIKNETVMDSLEGEALNLNELTESDMMLLYMKLEQSSIF